MLLSNLQNILYSILNLFFFPKKESFLYSHLLVPKDSHAF